VNSVVVVREAVADWRCALAAMHAHVTWATETDKQCPTLHRVERSTGMSKRSIDTVALLLLMAAVVHDFAGADAVVSAAVPSMDPTTSA
jgi:hypothetical protein